MPPRKSKMSILESEVNPATGHAEIAVVFANKVPAEIVQPADVAGETHFKAATYLPKKLGVAIMMDRTKSRRFASSDDNLVPFASAKNRSGAAENVGREPAAMKRITERDCSQGRSN